MPRRRADIHIQGPQFFLKLYDSSITRNSLCCEQHRPPCQIRLPKKSTLLRHSSAELAYVHIVWAHQIDQTIKVRPGLVKQHGKMAMPPEVFNLFLLLQYSAKTTLCCILAIFYIPHSDRKLNNLERASQTGSKLRCHVTQHLPE